MRLHGLQQLVNKKSVSIRYFHSCVTDGILFSIFNVDYHVGSMLGWSPVFRFKTLPEGTDWSPRMCLFGDMGNVNARSLGYIQEELTRDDFDVVLHVGKWLQLLSCGISFTAHIEHCFTFNFS